MPSKFTYSALAKASVAAVAVQVTLCLPLYVKADSALAGASVLITAQPSVLGALSTFQVNIVTSKSVGVTVNAAPEPNFSVRDLLNFGGNQTTRPALFSISGQPNQSFSIVMPQAGVSSSAKGNFEFSNFVHNAGSTPTIGSDGSKVFAVGAIVKFTPFPTAASGTSATAEGADSEISEAKLAKKTPAEKDLIPRPNPFGIQGVKDGFLNVLVSYN